MIMVKFLLNHLKLILKEEVTLKLKYSKRKVPYFSQLKLLKWLLYFLILVKDLYLEN